MKSSLVPLNVDNWGTGVWIPTLEKGSCAMRMGQTEGTSFSWSPHEVCSTAREESFWAEASSRLGFLFFSQKENSSLPGESSSKCLQLSSGQGPSNSSANSHLGYKTVRKSESSDLAFCVLCILKLTKTPLLYMTLTVCVPWNLPASLIFTTGLIRA